MKPAVRFDILTIFPEMCRAVVETSILKRAQEANRVRIDVHNLRDYADNKHKKVDDRPFGGGPGMVMSPQPIFDAVKAVKGRRKARVILTCPTGERWTQAKAKSFAKMKNLIIICGHYEGVDERVRLKLVDESVSIGDYVLTGGELPALVIIDSVTRLIPGVLGAAESLEDESFEQDRLDYPHYTRPENFRGLKVPAVLLSGNHQQVRAWRESQARKRTREKRPDLWEKASHPTRNEAAKEE